MRSNSRGRITATFGLALLGLVGCGQNNDDVVKQQAKATAGAAVPSTPRPKTQAELGQMQQQSKPFSKSSGYPGAKK